MDMKMTELKQERIWLSFFKTQVVLRIQTSSNTILILLDVALTIHHSRLNAFVFFVVHLETMRISYPVISVVKVSIHFVLRFLKKRKTLFKNTGNAKIVSTVKYAVVLRRKISFYIVINVTRPSICFARILRSHMYQIAVGDAKNASNVSSASQISSLEMSKWRRI